MSEAFEAVFGEPNAPEVVIESETVAETPAEQPAAEGPARGADGKFVSKASEPAESTEPAPAAAPEPVATQAEPGHVPLGTLLDEREKRQAEKARADALQRRIEELEAASKTGEPAPPELQLRAELNDLRAQNQRISLEVEHGKQAVADAYKWAFDKCDSDPAFNQEVASKLQAGGNPYQVALDAHKQHAELAEFQAWKAAKANPAAEPAPTQQSPPPAIPKSLVNAPGNGAVGKDHVPMEPGSAFGSVFS